MEHLQATPVPGPDDWEDQIDRPLPAPVTCPKAVTGDHGKCGPQPSEKVISGGICFFFLLLCPDGFAARLLKSDLHTTAKI